MWVLRGNRVMTETGVYYLEPDEADCLAGLVKDGFGHWAYERCVYLIDMGYAIKSKVLTF